MHAPKSSHAKGRQVGIPHSILGVGPGAAERLRSTCNHSVTMSCVSRICADPAARGDAPRVMNSYRKYTHWCPSVLLDRSGRIWYTCSSNQIVSTSHNHHTPSEEGKDTPACSYSERTKLSWIRTIGRSRRVSNMPASPGGPITGDYRSSRNGIEPRRKAPPPSICTGNSTPLKAVHKGFPVSLYGRWLGRCSMANRQGLLYAQSTQIRRYLFDTSGLY